MQEVANQWEADYSYSSLLSNFHGLPNGPIPILNMDENFASYFKICTYYLLYFL